MCKWWCQAFHELVGRVYRPSHAKLVVRGHVLWQGHRIRILRDRELLLELLNSFRCRVHSSRQLRSAQLRHFFPFVNFLADASSPLTRKKREGRRPSAQVARSRNRRSGQSLFFWFFFLFHLFSLFQRKKCFFRSEKSMTWSSRYFFRNFDSIGSESR